MTKKQFLALTLGLTLLVYLNSLNNAFVSDDITGILQNPNLGNFWNSISSFNLLGVLRALLFHLFGRTPWPFHLLNLGFHLGTTLMVYLALVKLTNHERLSRFSTLLFGLHPIHTEAVTWISGGGYPFYAFFFLLSLYLFIKAQEDNTKRIKLLTFSWLAFLIALRVRIWALPLPAIYLLHEKLFTKKKWSQLSWGFYVALAITVLLQGATYFVGGQAQARIAGITGGTDGTILNNPLITVPHSVTQSLYLLIWPLNLTLYHEGKIFTSAYIWSARVVAAIFLIVLPIVFRKSKHILFFWAFFVLSILIALSPIQVSWLVAERYLYLGSLSFVVLLAYFLLRVEQTLRLKHLATGLLSLVLMLYGIRTWVRNNDWQTRASLWFATAKVSPRSPKVHNNLGDIYGGMGDIDKSIEEFQKARKLQPGYADATHNLANAYMKKGEMEKAKKYFKQATEFNPYLYQSYHSLGVIAYREEEFDKAKAYFQRTIKINPNYLPSLQALKILKENPAKEQKEGQK